MALISFTNLIPNGDFEASIANGTVAGSGQWSSNFANNPTRQPNPTPTHGEGGDYALQNTGSVNGAAYAQLASNISVTAGRKYYMRCLTRFEGTKYAYMVQFYNNTTALANGIAAYIIGGGSEGVRNTWFLYDGGAATGGISDGGIWTAPSGVSDFPLRIQWTGGNGNQLRHNYVDQLMMIDVTELSQAPYSLNDAAIVQYMRNIYNIHGYWNGTINFDIPDGALTVDPIQTLSNGVRGQSYSNMINVSGGWQPYTFSIQSGNMPQGLNIHPATGVISGTISNITGNYGAFNFVVQISDGINTVVTKSYSIYVNAAPIIITNLLSNVITDEPYSFQVVADGTDTSPNVIHWSLIDGAFPSGISINSTGLITGSTNDENGEYSVELEADNGISPAATRIYNFRVSSAAFIVTTNIPNATSGTYYNQHIAVSGAEPVTLTHSGGDLPSGLSVVLDGGNYYLRGTPFVPNHDVYIFELTATNEIGQDIAVLSLTVGVAPSIITATLPNAIQNIAYSTNLASSGSTPISYQLLSGTMPSGIILNSNGTISGTTSQTGVFSNLLIQATNAYGSTTALFSLTVVQQSENALITTNTIPNGTVGTAYSFQVNATGFPVPAFDTTIANFPPGLSINSTGLITGNPTTQGQFTFTIIATNTGGSDSRQYTVIIGSAPSITATSHLTGIQGVLFVQTVSATGYPTPVWSAIGLPSGIALNTSNGTLQWNNPVAGTYNISITVTNTYGSDTKSIIINIMLPPQITTTALQRGVLNQYFTATLTATGDGSIIWSLIESDLPYGLNLSTSGVISGTPTEYGDFEIFVQASSSYGSHTRVFILSIEGPPIITSPSNFPEAGDSTPYTYFLQAEGTPPIVWSLGPSSSLPSWLNLNGITGELSAASPVTGIYSFTLVATNNIGSSQKAFILEVKTPSIINESILYAGLNDPFSVTFTAGGQPPFVFTWIAGSVPSGLIWDGTDTLYGVPDTAGIYEFEIGVQNAFSTNSKQFILYVGDFPFIVNEFKPVGEVGIFYSNQMFVEGTAPMSLSLIDGAAPGLTFNPSTLIYSGTPLMSGLYRLTFLAENILGTFEKSFNLLITEPSSVPGPDITNEVLSDGIIGQPYSDFITATGDDLEFAQFSGIIPAGLSLNIYTGEISGTPQGLGGIFNFAIICFNEGGFDIQSYEIFIATPPIILSRSLPDGITGESYSFQINSTGDMPHTFTVETPVSGETGTPNGLILSSSGLLDGTINDAEGAYTFTVKAQNESGYDTVGYSLNIESVKQESEFFIKGKPVEQLYAFGKDVFEMYDRNENLVYES